jgi:hypothetical protein
VSRNRQREPKIVQISQNNHKLPKTNLLQENGSALPKRFLAHSMPNRAQLSDRRQGCPMRDDRINTMRSGKPSRTAQMVAYCRALSTVAPQVPGFSDPFAAEFLPEKWRKWIERSRQATAARPGKSPYPFWVRRGQCLVNEFRTLVLDRAIVPAEPQLVVLGAGFDSRAWRLDALQLEVLLRLLRQTRASLWSRPQFAWLTGRNCAGIGEIRFDYRGAPYCVLGCFEPAPGCFTLLIGARKARKRKGKVNGIRRTQPIRQ